MERFILLISIVVAVSGCTRHTQLQSGIWRGELAVADDKRAPFLFEVQNVTADSTVVTLINGEERVPLTGIHYCTDTVIIPIEAYDAVIKAVVSENRLEGLFIKNYIENDSGIPFNAERGNIPRFEPVTQPTSFLIDGKWDILFVGTKNDTAPNVGVFKTENQTITGSILTNSGDLRFLEGALTEQGVRLSAFSGLSPYLVDIQFKDADSFEGVFYTARNQTKLVGIRNEHAALADAYSLARLKPGFSTLNFALPNTDGKIISIHDERYKDKVVIVSVLGSWCPNCLDELEFLAPWYKSNKDRGVEIIGLAFERKDDFDYAKTAINRLKERYGVEYEILFAGQAGAEAIAKVLPELEDFSSYPTTLFIDKAGKVRKIHTGYTGPATGLFYESFKEEFNHLIESLLN
ncbi:MAG: TlpA family protein disulfide reductase [Candidatus Symbiothrix sp.]|jgi:thiol-disulfide isomerase/thioredoxin|nr:TlpA family protein disulfide reductase [Candidatus Symbiothrix sp.]